MMCRYGVGHRMKLKHTRAIIDAIHSGELVNADVISTPMFDLQASLCSGCHLECLYSELRKQSDLRSLKNLSQAVGLQGSLKE